MHPAGIKKRLPKSLFWRAFLILVGPIILFQIIFAYIIVQRHFEAVTRQMTGEVARELRIAVDTVETAETADVADEALGRLAAAYSIGMTLHRDAEVTPTVTMRSFDLTGRQLVRTLEGEIGRPMSIDLMAFRKEVDIRIQTSKGVLQAIPRRRSMIVAQPQFMLVWMVGTAAALIAIASIFIRNQIRPIRRLAAAADAFGKGRTLKFHPSGAEEVRRAGLAFLDMRDRIERQIEQRTKMLSGVSHDLRTPLTRMKLTLEMAAPTPEADDLGRDVADMEHMLEEFLDFARTGRGEDAEETDPVALAEEIAGDARRKGGEVRVYSENRTPSRPLAPMRRGAVKRGLQNLIDNAMRFGEHAEISVNLTRKKVEFAVEDDGPGIAEADREAALRPFNRLDEARNQDRGGGVGLGLSIALDVARAHGGELRLTEGERLGGLKAVLRLPR